jgi:hypothetical protein
MEVGTRSERIETLFKGFSPPPTFNHARPSRLLSARSLHLPSLDSLRIRRAGTDAPYPPVHAWGGTEHALLADPTSLAKPIMPDFPPVLK